jgi:ribose transport system ATP-binding protein
MSQVIAPSEARLLEMKGITKRFPGVVALSDVTFDLKAAEIHCLVGENGAGKSTLMKILSGLYQADEGQLLLHGKPIQIRSPIDGLQQGIGVVYQELELMDDLSIAENMLLGREPLYRTHIMNWMQIRATAKRTLAELGLHLPPNTLVGRLTVAQKQLVAIAKALALHPHILVLDEPSATLAGKELDLLFELLRKLRSDGVGLVYISHRLEEVFNLGDRITVLRDGHVVDTQPVKAVTEHDLIRKMVGREVSRRFPERPQSVESQVLLHVQGLTTDAIRDVSFDLHKGEVLGFAGLVGCGVDSLARALMGIEPIRHGIVTVGEKRSHRLSPQQVIKSGMILVPEDRKTQGLVLIHPVYDNMSYSGLPRYARWGFIHFRQLTSILTHYRERLNVKTASFGTQVGSLSGGNQQKVILGRVLMTQPRILILDEPTRGIDVGAKAEIYQLILNFAAEGYGVVLISSELVEVTALSHRILVMSEGVITASMEPPYVEAEILQAALPKSVEESEEPPPSAMKGEIHGNV